MQLKVHAQLLFRHRSKFNFLAMRMMILMLVAFIQVHGKALSQNKITLDLKAVSLDVALDKISRQVGYDYAFQGQWKDKAQKVTLAVRESSLEQVLKLCFQNQPFTYAIVNSTIVVKSKSDPEKEDHQQVNTIDVNGQLKNDKNEPIVGASIQVRGTKKMAVSDDYGRFIIKGVEETAEIFISSIGYADTTIQLEGRSLLLIRLNMKISQLNVATISVNNGFQQVPRERATGSFAFLSNEGFNRKVSTNVLDRLEGNIPGLLINRNTNPNNNPTGIDISIRGYSTLFANAQPLIVVDNFPYDGNINNINPNDVESISILKDAAAASIWGVQSGNGVIIITTKKGRRNQKMQVDFNVNTTLGEKPDLFYNRNFVGSSDFIDVEKTLFDAGYYNSMLTDSRHPPVSPVVQLLANAQAGTISQAEADKQINGFRGVDVRNDLKKYFYQHSISQQYYVGLKGGGETNSYNFSVGYDKNALNVVGNGNGRFTLNSSTEFYPIKNLTLSAGFNFIQSKSQYNNTLGDITMGGNFFSIYPYARLVGPNGESLSIVKDYNQQWIQDPAAQAGLLSWQYKPLNELKYVDNAIKAIETRLYFGARYHLLKGLNVDVKYQYDKMSTNFYNYYSDSTYYTRNLINQYTNLNGSPKYPIPIGGIYMQGNGFLTSNRLRAQATYDNYIDADNNVTAILGADISQVDNEQISAATMYGFEKSNGSNQNVDYTTNYPLFPSNNATQIPNGQGYRKSTDRYVSYFSNLSYTYKDRYIITASGRIDKSNLFGVNTNQKSIPLYSIGAGWNMSNEAFYHSSVLPYSKLRATFGFNGNVNKSATAVVTTSQRNGSYFYGLPYEQVINPGNPELRWEKIRVMNFGYDFAFKKYILSGSIEYYLKKGIDLFGNSSLPPSTGLTTFFGNTANISGHGLDITLNAKIIDRHDFHWNANFIFSNAIDKVTKYDPQFSVGDYILTGPDANSIRPTVGKPIFGIYGYKWGGLTHDNGDPQGYLNGKLSTDYAGILANITSVDSLFFAGSARPTTFGSLRNTLSYKGLSLSFNLIYKLNYYFKRSSISYAGFFQSWSGQSEDITRRWQKPGDEMITNVPSMPSITNLDPNRDAVFNDSQALIDKGDHIRLQEITLSYDLNPQKILNNTFKEARIYFFVNNVGILWRANKDHLDPDIYTGGLPTPRTYSLGLKTTF